MGMGDLESQVTSGFSVGLFFIVFIVMFFLLQLQTSNIFKEGKLDGAEKYLNHYSVVPFRGV